MFRHYLTFHLALALAASTGASSASPGNHLDTGCFVSATKGGAMWENRLKMEESGLFRVDSGVKNEIEELASTFGVRADFGFINDLDGANAYASPGHDVYRVMFGIRMLHRMSGTLNPVEDKKIPQKFPEVWEGAMGGVIAHEWAHVLQFKQGLIFPSPVTPSELHADFLAGWYMGMKGQRMKIAYEELKQEFFAMGDTNFNDRDHHGTPEQRRHAMSSGYELATSGMHDVQQAFDKGMRLYGLSKK
ncbi:hypothetical protein OX462_15485 [Janthinobacterium sp. SUN098]|uniref:hypothetical protein n=1 Tax=Janthinobacterium TaxID=29580 RepID=UPI000874CDF7|nr:MULTISPECIES: hypothetical protein [Janthinobacterium]